MKTLDRYIVRSYLTTALMFFLVFMSLRIVIDLFVNMDEFAEQADSFRETLGYIAEYYSYQSLSYFTELGGVIVVAAAAFTLARFNHTNELTAMLASGVSLYRVVWPIVLSAMLVSGLIIVDQEMLIPIPEVRVKLVRSRDDRKGQESRLVELMTDGNRSVWFSPRFSPSEETMFNPVILLRDENGRAMARLTGDTARPGVHAGTTGWMLANGRLSWVGRKEDLPTTNRVFTAVGPERIVAEALKHPEFAGVDPSRLQGVNRPRCDQDDIGLTLQAEKLSLSPAVAGGRRGGTLEKPAFTFRGENGEVLGVFLAASATWQADASGVRSWELAGGALFYPTDLTAKDAVLRQHSRWLSMMSTAQLSELLKLKRVPDQGAAVLTKHIRVTDPLNNLIMLLLGLPFILSRERNIKASAGFCLLIVMAFYASIHICRNVGLSPGLAAWLPVLAFGPVAVLMFDSIKT